MVKKEKEIFDLCDQGLRKIILARSGNTAEAILRK